MEDVDDEFVIEEEDKNSSILQLKRGSKMRTRMKDESKLRTRMSDLERKISEVDAVLKDMKKEVGEF